MYFKKKDILKWFILLSSGPVMLDEFVEWLKEQPDQGQSNKASWKEVRCCKH